MRAAQASTTGFSRGTQRNLKQVGTQMQGIGRSATMFITAPIALAGAGMVKAAMDWESSWAGVTKTVDGTATQMAELEDGLRSMTKELPATHGEIAAVAEAAGALGVAQEDILGFTRVMIDLGETTNLSADEAATSIAKMMNVMQTAPDDVDNFGAALVDLGNNGASTEAEILDMATRIAGAAATVGMSEQDVLGFANGLASLGLEAELGGTAISRVMTEIDKAVSLTGPKLDLFAETAGMSARQFSEAWQADPTTALLEFIEGLGRLDSAGGSVDQRFKDLGLNGTRVGDVLKRLINSGDLLTDSVEMSNTAWGVNTALTEEAGKRYDTTAAKFEVVRNKIVDLAIDLGEILLPIVEAVVEVAGNFAEAFQGLPGPVQAVVLAFGGLLAAIGPVVFLAGTFLKNFVQIRAFMGAFSGVLGSAGKAFGALGLAAVAGFAIYQVFTAEQRKTEENTRRATAALDTQFGSLIATAVAAARAGEEIDAVAVANEALSRALAEGNEQLADSAAVLNIGAEGILDVFSLMEADGSQLITTMDYLARSFGLNAEQADFVAKSYGMLMSPVPALAASSRELGEALGITSAEFDALLPAISSFLDAADEQSIQKITASFLNAQVEASNYEDSLVGAAEAQTGLNRNIEGEAIGVYRAYAELVANATDEQLEAAGVTEEVQANIAALTPVLEDAGAGFEEMALSGADAMEVLAGSFADFKRDMVTGKDLGAFDWSWIDSLGESLRDVTSIQQNYISTQDGIHKANYALQQSYEDNGKALTGVTEEAIANRDVMAGYVNAIYDHAEAQLASGDSVEQVTETFKHNRDGMIEAAVAAGYERDEVEALVDQLGAADKDWTAVLVVSGDEIAMQKIEELLVELDSVDDNFIAQLNAKLKTDGAWATLQWLKRQIDATEGTVDVNVRVRNPVVRISNNGATVTAGHVRATADAAGAFVPGGSMRWGTTGEIPGSRGDEVILPLGNPARMSSLLGLSSVGPRVAAAMGAWMPQHGWSGGSGSSTNNTSVTVVMPPGSNGDDVVRALRKWERRRGPVPITVR